MNKTNVPFEIIEAINDLYYRFKKNISISYKIDNENLTILSTTYSDKYWYKIKLKPNYKNDSNVYNCTYLPYDKNKLIPRSVDISPDKISEFFEHWLNIVDKYENSKTFLDDQFLEKYQEEIYENIFKFVKEDDDDLPYKLNIQFQFIDYLNNLEEIINKGINNEENDKIELQESLKLIAYIKDNINKLSKGEIKKKFSLSLARIAKSSLSFFQEIIKSVIIETTVKLITGQH